MPGWGCPPDWGALTSVPHPCAGITRFDLLGDFGRFNWLGNFYIVFLYNMGFAGLTTLCLVKRVSWAVQAELIRAFGEDRDMRTQGWVLGCPLCPQPGSHTLPISRSAQAAAARDALPDPQQALLSLGDNRDVSSPLWWPPGWLPATELALVPQGHQSPSGKAETPLGVVPPALSQRVVLLSLGLEPHSHHTSPRGVGCPQGCAGCSPPTPCLNTSCRNDQAPLNLPWLLPGVWLGFKCHLTQGLS